MIWFGGANVGWLVWGAQNSTRPKIETKLCLGLKWPKLKRKTQQPTECRHSALAVIEILERWRAVGGARGEMLSHCLGHWIYQRKNNENKIRGSVNWLPIGGPKHNNQPKTGSRNGGENWGGMQQANKMLSLVINFFLGRSTELNKTLINRPWSTPSKEAPGGGVGWFATSMPLLRQSTPPCYMICWWLTRQRTIKIYYSYIDMATVA